MYYITARHLILVQIVKIEENPAMIKGSREMRLPFLFMEFIIFGWIPYENWWSTNLCKYP